MYGKRWKQFTPGKFLSEHALRIVIQYFEREATSLPSGAVRQQVGLDAT